MVYNSKCEIHFLINYYFSFLPYGAHMSMHNGMTICANVQVGDFTFLS